MFDCKQTPFFVSALNAAKQGLEMFAKEFEKKNADANVTENIPGRYHTPGSPLIHDIIKELPDLTLPDILTILVLELI